MLKRFRQIIAILSFAFVVFVAVSPAYAQSSSACETAIEEIEIELDDIVGDLDRQVDDLAARFAAERAISNGLRINLRDAEKALGEERERRFKAEARAPGWKWALGGAAAGAAATVVVYLLVVK